MLPDYFEKVLGLFHIGNQSPCNIKTVFPGSYQDQAVVYTGKTASMYNDTAPSWSDETWDGSCLVNSPVPLFFQFFRIIKNTCYIFYITLIIDRCRYLAAATAVKIWMRLEGPNSFFCIIRDITDRETGKGQGYPDYFGGQWGNVQGNLDSPGASVTSTLDSLIDMVSNFTVTIREHHDVRNNRHLDWLSNSLFKPITRIKQSQ